MIRCKDDNFKIRLKSFLDVKIYDSNEPINIDNINQSNFNADFFYFFYPFNFKDYPLLVKNIYVNKYNHIVIETVQECFKERIKLLWVLLRNNIKKLPKAVIACILKYTNDYLYVRTIQKRIKNYIYFMLNSKTPLYIEMIPE